MPSWPFWGSVSLLGLPFSNSAPLCNSFIGKAAWAGFCLWALLGLLGLPFSNSAPYVTPSSERPLGSDFAFWALLGLFFSFGAPFGAYSVLFESLEDPKTYASVGQGVKNLRSRRFWGLFCSFLGFESGSRGQKSTLASLFGPILFFFSLWKTPKPTRAWVQGSKIYARVGFWAYSVLS